MSGCDNVLAWHLPFVPRLNHPPPSALQHAAPCLGSLHGRAECDQWERVREEEQTPPSRTPSEPKQVYKRVELLCSFINRKLALTLCWLRKGDGSAGPECLSLGFTGFWQASCSVMT